MITKRFISFNGLSYIPRQNQLIRIGNDTSTEIYYEIINNYKYKEKETNAILRWNQKIIINPKLDPLDAKEILDGRYHIQRLQYVAMDHYLSHNNQLHFVTKKKDREAQIRHEFIINLYRKYLEYPTEEFIYTPLPYYEIEKI